MELQWFVGLDWSKSHHQICLVDRERQTRGETVIPHSGAGFQQLAAWLAEKTRHAPSERIGIVLETSVGSVVKSCQTLGYEVYAINPIQLDRFRDRHYPAGAKDDRREALLLVTALCLEPHLVRPVEIEDEDTMQLRLRNRRRNAFGTTRSALITQIRQLLEEYFPSFVTMCGDHLASPFAATLWHRIPNPQKAHQTRVSTVVTILKQHRMRRFKASAILEQLRAEPLPIPQYVMTARQQELTMLWEQMHLVNKQIQTLEQQIAEQLDARVNALHDVANPATEEPARPTDEAILASMPGVGKTVLATLFGEAGSVIRNRDYQALRCLTGVAPVTKSSGKYRRVQRRRTANRQLSDSVYHWGRVAMIHDSVCREKYQRLRAKGHTHGRALRSIVDRLLYVACAMLNNGTLYQNPATES
ncbi:MAG: IS110 family transposase [Gammaproteobacteria bacterium]|nr:IS110 family transposase [Gammaproteobacteria bacterium]